MPVSGGHAAASQTMAGRPAVGHAAAGAPPSALRRRPSSPPRRGAILSADSARGGPQSRRPRLAIMQPAAATAAKAWLDTLASPL